MVSVLKHNYCLEDLLLKEASQLEMAGSTAEAHSRLDDALKANEIQKRSLSRAKKGIYKWDMWPPLQVFNDWVLDDEIDWSDIPDFNPNFSSGAERYERKQGRKKGAYRKFIKKKDKDEDEISYNE